MSIKSILKEIFLGNITGTVTTKRIEENLGRISELLGKLKEEGLVKIEGENVFLTEKGRSHIKVVLTGGVFDIIHPGHIYTLKRARGLGDVLVVIVARDETVIRMRGRRAVNDENLRLELVSNLKPVDLALLGCEDDIFKTLEKVRPDIVALGYDQAHSEEELIEEGRKRGLKFEVVRLDTPYPHLKSTTLKSNPDVVNTF